MSERPRTTEAWAIYCRFSDATLQDRASADSQERECRAVLAARGHDVAMVERDEGRRAGAALGRVGWRNIVEAARARQIDGVLVWELSRSSRDFFAGVAELGELRRLGIRFADCSREYDLSEPSSQIQLGVGYMMAEAETARLGQRSKRGLSEKTLARYSAGGAPPYGYARHVERSETELDLDGAYKKLGVRFVPSEREAPIVKRIFRMYADGWTKRGIAMALNEEGVPTRRVGKVRLGEKILGVWSAASVRGILRNPIYIGIRHWNVTSRTGEKLPTSGKKRAIRNDPSAVQTVTDFAPSLVEKPLWDRVATRLADDAKTYAKQHYARKGQGKLLSGFLRCGSCGGSFVIGSHVKAGPEYRCGLRQTRGNVVCTNGTRALQFQLEAKVKSLLDAVAKDPAKLSAVVAEHNRRTSAANASQRALVDALIERQKRLTLERDNLVEVLACASDRTRLTAVTRALEVREAELEGLAERIRDAEALVQPLLMPKPSTVADHLAGRASLFSGDLVADRALLQRVVERIVVHASGDILLHFREADLFGPMRSMTTDEPVLDDTTKRAHRIIGRLVARYVDEEKAKGRDVTMSAVQRGDFIAYTPAGSAAETAMMTLRGFEPRLQP